MRVEWFEKAAPSHGGEKRGPAPLPYVMLIMKAEEATSKYGGSK